MNRLLCLSLVCALLTTHATQAEDLKKVAAAIDGYRFEFPCKYPMPENPKPGADGISARLTDDPKTNDKFTDVRTFGGEPGKKYKVTLRVRGVVERNAMRYYLAIDAYLASLAAPEGEQVERRIQAWFNASERYARQLREMDRATYVALKRGEYERQQTALN